jgi:hypothetical protein
MGLAHVDRQELDPALAILLIERVQRGDLPDERRSGDGAELEHHVLPRRSERRTGVPSSAVSVKSGASSPTRTVLRNQVDIPWVVERVKAE